MTESQTAASALQKVTVLATKITLRSVWQYTQVKYYKSIQVVVTHLRLTGTC